MPPLSSSPSTRNARYWIEKLGLKEHPEGGYFKETFRSDMNLYVKGRGRRSASTAIYYLLEKGQRSVFHRIKSDELWHFYAGSPLHLYVIDGKRRKSRGRKEERDATIIAAVTLGPDPDSGQALQAAVRAGCWFAAESAGSYSLVGCTVAPGFDFDDWQVGSRDYLGKRYPQHAALIERLSE